MTQTATQTPGSPKRASTRLCVRCGTHPRADEVWVCESCWRDPALRREMSAARQHDHDGLAQRRWLVAEKGWKGGWGRGT